MDLERISQALQNYTGQEESMRTVASVLQEELGENWTATVFEDLKTLPPALKDNLTHAYNYYAATMAWNEVQEYLAQKDLKSTPELQERLPILKHWLEFFGAPGISAYNDFEQRISMGQEPENLSAESKVNINGENATEPTNRTVDNSSETVLFESNTEGDVEPTANIEDNSETKQMLDTKEVDTDASNAESFPSQEESPEVFEIKKMERQLDLLHQNQAWLAARCIQLKNIEIYAYPFYGFVVDLLRQTLKTIEKLEETPDIDVLLDQYLEGGKEALSKHKEAIQHDIELAEQNCESAATALISEDTDMDEVRRTLGTIDTSDTVEYIGPAPDGFELLDDDVPLDEGVIKEQYEKLETMDALTGKQENPPAESSSKENTSQNAQKGVQKKLSFSLKRKKPTET